MRWQGLSRWLVVGSLVGLLVSVVAFSQDVASAQPLSQMEFENRLAQKDLPIGLVWCNCQDYISEGYREYEVIRYEVKSTKKDQASKGLIAKNKAVVIAKAISGAQGFMTINACESLLQLGQDKGLKKACPRFYRAPSEEILSSNH